MLRYKLKELIAKAEFRSDKRITLDSIAEATGIHRTTLSKISGQRGYNTTTDTLNKLCAYFNCRVEDLVEYVPDDEMK